MTENNKRKIAFREEALTALGQLDHEPTYEDVRNAYKLDCFECKLHEDTLPHPKSQNCRDNPYCINRLGLEKFAKLLKNEQQNADKVEKNMKRRNIHDQPCGLRNAGNFCYVNSFLQVFFNDPVFRQVVYKWRKSTEFKRPIPPKMDVEAVMSSMQHVFFCLEYTPYEDTTTFDFTEVLRLGNNQQDAQEFTLMFLAALERHLPTHPNGQPIVDFIKKRFYGKWRTRTWCECGGRDNQEFQPFMSIQLPIDGVKTLHKAIERHFETEKLHECRCEACGHQDKVSRKTEIVELPAILIIQLNRYVNDMIKMCQRKLRSPLAYPKVLKASFLQPNIPSAEDYEYELFAVMIHEGDNTHCGHYYDLIKHPYMDKWFKYNDEIVEPLAKPPGYDKMARVGKENKAPNDIKACYGLLYRKKESMHSCEPPGTEISNPWREEFETAFSNLTGHEIKKSSTRVREIKTRYTELSNVFSNLKAHTDRYKNEKKLAFVPLELLTDILEKECEYASKRLKEMETIESDEEPSAKSSRLHNGSSSPIKRSKELTGKISREEIAITLKQTTMKLCPHGLVSIEAVLFGDVKIVSRASAEHLLSRYNFLVRKMTSSGEENSTVFTGVDICLVCAKRLQDEARFKIRLDATTKTVMKILKEKNRDSLKKEHPEDYFYVGKKALNNFAKSAEQQFRYENWLDDSNYLLFIPGARQNISNAQQILKTRKRRCQINDLAEVDSNNKYEYNVVKTIVDEIVEEVCNSSTSDHNGVHSNSSSKAIENGDKQCEDQLSRPSTPISTKPEMVVFNQILQCEHGEVNIHEFRQAVSPEEWNELHSYFTKYFTVKCSYTVCNVCKHEEDKRINDVETRGLLKKELKVQFGNIIRALEKRFHEPSEIGKKYTYGICSGFVNAMKSAFRRTTEAFDLPIFCQECVICELHQCPYKPLIGTNTTSTEDNRIIPLTEEEWDSLCSQWPTERLKELTPIVLSKDGIEGFCSQCFENHMFELKLSKMNFENEFVYVKVETLGGKSESKSEPHLEKRGSRRNVPKNVYRFKMSSNDTVKNLKVKLYEKIHQTPSDQMLYNDDVLLDNDQTLYDAMIEPNNTDKPLRVLVHTVHSATPKFIDEEREPEMGFTGTALAF